MFTKVKVKETGEFTSFRSEQFGVGLYVIINNDPAQQFNLDNTEQNFHDDIRNNPNFEVVEE